MDERITFVLTSCGRFDLLRETVATFLEFNTAPIERYILVEDSGDARVRDVLANFHVPFQLLINKPQIGQIASIDRAYETIDTPYIFHCEDDWRFFRPGFVEESLRVLRSDPGLTNVLSRRPGQNPMHDRIYQLPVREVDGVRYRKAGPDLDDAWFGWSFNPGLLRLAEYRRIGPFARCGGEEKISRFFKSQGMYLATLEEPACETTGSERRLPVWEKHRPLVRHITWFKQRVRRSLEGAAGR